MFAELQTQTEEDDFYDDSSDFGIVDIDYTTQSWSQFVSLY